MHAHTKHVNDTYAHNMKVKALLGSVMLVFRIFFFAMNCKLIGTGILWIGSHQYFIFLSNIAKFRADTIATCQLLR
jgi:hypothetical protein